MAYGKKTKLQNGGKLKATEDGTSLRAKITKEKLSGRMKDKLYNGVEKGKIKKKK